MFENIYFWSNKKKDNQISVIASFLFFFRLLTKCLAPESALKEPDENWNWDVVFAQVSGELHKEWFSDGEKDPDKITTTNAGETNLQADIEGPGTSNRITKERPYTAFNRFPV